MNKYKQLLGQILSAVGLTLAAGGVASFVFSNVELRFFGQEIFKPDARVLWVVVSSSMAVLGLLLLYAGRRSQHLTTDHQ